MTHKLIKTDDYLLVVESKELTDKEFYDGAVTGKWIAERKILAHLPLNGSPILEGVDLLPPLEDDVTKLAEVFGNNLGDSEQESISISFGYKEGYNKAREKYKYTEEDVIKVIDIMCKNYTKPISQRIGQTEIIQSLSQYPTEFECEMDIVWVKNSYGRVQTKDDLHGVPKTTTINGRKVWVGKYK